METISWWEAPCTYCGERIDGMQTPMTSRAGGPVNMDWNHRVRPDDEHQAVPRGKTTRYRLHVSTSLGVTRVEPIRSDALALGDVFIGPDLDTVYRVLVPCSADPQGWLRVQNVALDGVACSACEKAGDVRPECETCGGSGLAGGGFFTFSEVAEPAMWSVAETY